MNLRNIANSATCRINPNIDAILRVNTGYTINEYGEQVPKFEEQSIVIQFQSLQAQGLNFLDLIQQQGSFGYAYISERVYSQVRKQSKGNDKLIFSRFKGDPPDEWLVKQAMEDFGKEKNDHWVKVLLWLQ